MKSGVNSPSLTLPATWLGPGLLVLVALLYWPTVDWLQHEWRDDATYGHGFLIAAVSLWLLYRAGWNWQVGVINDRKAIPAILFLSLFWLLGFASDTIRIQVGILPLLLMACMVSIGGWRILRTHGFPILYLYFAMPVWESVTPSLQTATVIVSGWLIRLLGLPALIEGNFVSIPSGSFEIAGGCAGARFLIVALALSSLYGYLHRLPVRVFAQVVLAAGIAAMVMNWIRVAMIVAIGYVTDMQHPFISDHASLGWILFAVGALAFLVIARRFPSLAGLPWAELDEGGSRNAVIGMGTSFFVVAALAAGPAWGLFLIKADIPRQVSLALPSAPTTWSGPVQAEGGWKPRYAGADGEILGLYRSEKAEVWVYANLYLVQTQDKELIHVGNSVAGAWRKLHEVKSRSEGAGWSLDVLETEVDDGRRRWLVYRWYVVDGMTFNSPSLAKLAQGLGVLAGGGASGLVALAAPCLTDCDQASRQLDAFLSAMGGKIEARITDSEAESP